ncbi:hypothetical protein VNI00_009998 [Paramarasmius palmivorus]|uniref:Uncharacterized protein n=1 Tax=Paramarasmius palmivorus TaxID=297713 RepID=A0AAW0CNY2_9AGAR
MSNSLSSVVSTLVRAQMGSSVSQTVTDDDLDRHVRELLVRDAKKRAEKYGQQGIRAYLSSGLSDSNAPKTNKRFLSSIIRSTDDHNKTVLRAQARAAEEIKRERRENEIRERKVRAEEAVAAEKSRRLDKRFNDSEGIGRPGTEMKRTKAEKKTKVTRGTEIDTGEVEGIAILDHVLTNEKETDTNAIEGLLTSVYGAGRDIQAPRSVITSATDPGHQKIRETKRIWIIHVLMKLQPENIGHTMKNVPRNVKVADPGRPLRLVGLKAKVLVVNVQGTKRTAKINTRRVRHVLIPERKDKKKRYALSSDSEEDIEDRERTRTRRKSPSPSSPDSSSRSHSTTSPSKARDSKDREAELAQLVRSTRKEQPEDEFVVGSSRDNRNAPSKTSSSDAVSNHSTSPEPKSRASTTHSSVRRNASSSTLSDRDDDDDDRPDPPVQLPSKMDRYFEESYDPRLDVAPLSMPKVPATGLIDNAEFEGWDAMLELIRMRREDKAEKKRLERMGLSKDEIKQTVYGTSTAVAGQSNTSGVRDRWNSEGNSIMDIQYKKRGAVREWDLGKEGF